MIDNTSLVERSSVLENIRLLAKLEAGFKRKQREEYKLNESTIKQSLVVTLPLYSVRDHS